MPEKEGNFFEFPDGFLWGAATSSHQVEGDNEFNDWWIWEKRGLTLDRSARAADHYRLYREDLKLAKRLNHNSFRFSVEWSRIEPKIGLWNKEALTHYEDVIGFCVKLNLEPIVTINHFTLPAWFSGLGGWARGESVGFFERFVEKVVSHLGKNVKYWVIFNEPVVYIYKSYIEGVWPPGRRSYPTAIAVFRNLLRASCRAYNVIHKTYREKRWEKPRAGVAKQILVFEPCSSKSRLDRLAASGRDYFFNHLFLKILVDRKALDFIGVNYYRRDYIHNSGLSPAGVLGDTCPASHNHAKGGVNFLGWESYPKGLSRKLLELKRFNLPFLITENGFCSEDDNRRWDYIYSHLIELASALRQGVNVIGYLYWSLIDNFEWADGFGPRFGLIGIDYKTQKRHIRASAYKFAAICGENRLRIGDNG